MSIIMNSGRGQFQEGFGQETHTSVNPVDTEKFDKLEKLFNCFRAEVDMKFKIMQQILTTRDEQVLVQKELLEREHSLYRTLLGHWKNTPVLAASGLSLSFSSMNKENVKIRLQQQDNEEYDEHGERFDDEPATTIPASRRNSQRPRKRKRSARGTTEHSEDLPSSDTDADDPNYENQYADREVEDDIDGNSNGLIDQVALGSKLYVEFKTGSADKLKPGNSVWYSFLREENGQSALCKLCDKMGIQKILKTAGGSTSALHTHLKSRHQVSSKTTNDGDKEKSSPAFKKALNDSDTIKDKSPRPGSVWNYFRKSNDSNSSKCQLCEKDGIDKVFKVHTGGSTTGLHRHLARVHKINSRSGESSSDATNPANQTNDDLETVDFIKSDSEDNAETRIQNLDPQQLLQNSQARPQVDALATHTETEWELQPQQWNT